MSVDPLDQMQKLRADAARSAAASKHPEAKLRGFIVGASLVGKLTAMPVPGAVADVFTERAKLRQAFGADAALLTRVETVVGTSAERMADTRALLLAGWTLDEALVWHPPPDTFLGKLDAMTQRLKALAAEAPKPPASPVHRASRRARRNRRRRR